jgi:hypothetical protein
MRVMTLLLLVASRIFGDITISSSLNVPGGFSCAMTSTSGIGRTECDDSQTANVVAVAQINNGVQFVSVFAEPYYSFPSQNFLVPGETGTASVSVNDMLTVTGSSGFGSVQLDIYVTVPEGNTSAFFDGASLYPLPGGHGPTSVNLPIEFGVPFMVNYSVSASLPASQTITTESAADLSFEIEAFAADGSPIANPSITSELFGPMSCVGTECNVPPPTPPPPPPAVPEPKYEFVLVSGLSGLWLWKRRRLA